MNLFSKTAPYLIHTNEFFINLLKEIYLRKKALVLISFHKTKVLRNEKLA